MSVMAIPSGQTGIASDKCHRRFLFKTFHPGQIEEAIKNLRDIQLTGPR